MQTRRHALRQFVKVALSWLAPALLSAACVAAPCESADHLTRVTGGGECLLIKTFGHAEGTKTLFVLLHGNHTSGSPAVSHLPLADTLAKLGPPGTVAVALIRPGYDDAKGNYSSGDALRRADNFTAENIDIVADAIRRLRSFHAARRVVLIGHSGGEAMAGVVLGRRPGLVDAAVLMACPCDVPAWRAMLGRRDFPWSSESAIRYVDRVPRATRVAVVVGGRDEVTPPALSRTYADALRARGIAADLSILDGVDHVAVLGSPVVVSAALRLGEGQ